MALAIASERKNWWDKRARANSGISLDEITAHRYNQDSKKIDWNATLGQIDTLIALNHLANNHSSPEEAKMRQNHLESVSRFNDNYDNGRIEQKAGNAGFFERIINKVYDGISNGVRYAEKSIGNAISVIPSPARYATATGSLAAILLFTGCNGNAAPVSAPSPVAKPPITQPYNPEPAPAPKPYTPPASTPAPSAAPTPIITPTPEPVTPTPTYSLPNPYPAPNVIETSGKITIEGIYSGFYDFPKRFFEENSLSIEQVVKITDAQYLSLKKMHNSISPYKFCKIEYDPRVYGSTTPYGIKLGDAAFPSLNSGHHRWEVAAHEQGHNFFGGTSPFYYQMAAPHPFLQESLAVLSAFYAFHDIQENQQAYNIDDKSIASLIFDFENGRKFQEEKYNEYLSKGKTFNIDDVLTSQALDFKMINYGEKYGWDNFQNLAKAFQNGIGGQFTFQNDGSSAIEQSTYIVAALSAAFNQDFRQDFKNLNFPIDDKFFESAIPLIRQYIGSH